MRDDPSLENILRKGLHGADHRDRHPSPGLIQAALAEATERSRRRRQRSTVGLVTGALAVCGAGLTVLVVLPPADDSGTGGVTAPAPLTSKSHPAQEPPSDPNPVHTVPPDQAAFNAAYSWARALPRGPRPTVPYVVGSTLHRPDGSQLQIPAEDVELIGAGSPGIGIVVFTEQPDVTRSRYQLIRPDGSAVDLQDATMRRAQDAVLSPSGASLAVDTGVFDVETGRDVGSVPDDARRLDAWVSAGVLYDTADGSYRLWDPDTGVTTTLPGSPGEHVHGTDLFLNRSGECSVAQEVRSTGPVELGRLCEAGPMLTVSPDGKTFITRDLRVHSPSDGEEGQPLAGAPEGIQPFLPQIVWVGDSSFYFALGSPDPPESLVVRCDVITAQCARAVDSTPVNLDDQVITLP